MYVNIIYINIHIYVSLILTPLVNSGLNRPSFIVLIIKGDNLVARMLL